MVSHNVPQTCVSEGVPFNGGHSGKGEVEEGDMGTKMNALCMGVEGDGKTRGGGALDVDPDVGCGGKAADDFGGERGGHEEGEGMEERKKGEGNCGVAEEE